MTVIDSLMMLETWFGLAVGIALNDKAKGGLAAVFTNALPGNSAKGREAGEETPSQDDTTLDEFGSTERSE